jgi:hypothetical protein
MTVLLLLAEQQAYGAEIPNVTGHSEPGEAIQNQTRLEMESIAGEVPVDRFRLLF